MTHKDIIHCGCSKITFHIVLCELPLAGGTKGFTYTCSGGELMSNIILASVVHHYKRTKIRV